MAELYKQGI